MTAISHADPCPKCGLPTRPHCDVNCHWWVCDDCSSWGNEKRYYDPEEKEIINYRE